MTLSEGQVQRLAMKAAAYSDSKHQIAPAASRYARRLSRLVQDYRQWNGETFNHRVSISAPMPLTDGSIRVYSGLMDLMGVEELRFVLGHEMGHVVREHSEKQMRLALAGSAVRKDLASQENMVGHLARSGLVGDVAERLVQARFSQTEEMDADEYALRFLKKNGHNPAAAMSALKKTGRLRRGYLFSLHSSGTRGKGGTPSRPA